LQRVRGIFPGPVIGRRIGTAARSGGEVLGADRLLGTPFVAATESLAPDPYKQMLITATHDDMLTTAAVTGVKANWLKGSLKAVGIDPDKGNIDAPNFGDPNIAFKRWKDTWSAGQSVDLVQKIEPAADIVARFVREYEAVT
jgi:nitronate monooxygenase